VTAAARRIASGERPGRIVTELYAAISAAVADEIGRAAAAAGSRLPGGAGNAGVGTPAEEGGPPEHAEGVELPPFVDPDQSAMLEDAGVVRLLVGALQDAGRHDSRIVGNRESPFSLHLTQEPAGC
jgi:hypothetical protein